MKKIVKVIVILVSVALFYQCSSDDSNTTYTPPADPDLTHPNDLYLYDNNGNSLFERYGTATRWRWSDNFVQPSQNATPIASELVIDATKIVDYLWVEPYTETGIAANKFIEELFPPELVYIGSYIYNNDGTRLLGYAEGGARITLLNMNALDYQDEDWLANPSGGVLATVHHEFSHIVHQNYGIPPGFNTISESYLGNGWRNNVSLADAIKLGMVRNYGTLNEFEDFCEIIANFLVVDKELFEELFITQEDCSAYTDAETILFCQELNEGRKLINRKVELVKSFYKSEFNVDLVAVRDILQARLAEVIENNGIPD